jgi:hypothetical protein
MGASVAAARFGRFIDIELSMATAGAPRDPAQPLLHTDCQNGSVFCLNWDIL